MIKLSIEQLFASGFVKIFMDIIRIFVNITFISWIYGTIFSRQQTVLQTVVSPMYNLWWDFSGYTTKSRLRAFQRIFMSNFWNRTFCS